MAAEETKANTTATQEQVKVTAQKQPKPEAEKQTNCPACNKQLKKIKQYYRNGKFYCNKQCWRKSTAKPDEAKK